MLKKFEFGNSYSYRERVTLDMSAALSGELDNEGLPLPVNSELFEVVRHRDSGSNYGILPVAAIYGKNAGGKTKLLNSLRDMALDVLGVSFSEATVHSNMNPFQQIIAQRQFLLLSKDNRNPGISYCVCIVLDNTEYMLSYTIENSGVTKEKVTRRTLHKGSEPELLYNRKSSGYDLGVDEFINKNLELMQARQEKQLWFPLIAPACEGLRDVHEWFRYVRDGINFNDSNNQSEKFEHIAKRISEDAPDGGDVHFRKRLSDFLRSFDKSIVSVDGFDLEGTYSLWIFHRMADDSGDPLVHLIEKESAGTRKLIEQFSLIDRCLENGMPFICDELDKTLHPAVFKQLVRMFNDPKVNPNNAQLIFSAHDTIALDSNFLRRDQVHIIDKGEDSVSTIKRLSEMENVMPYPDMEHEFRTGYYGSFPEDFYNCYDIQDEHETNT